MLSFAPPVMPKELAERTRCPLVCTVAVVPLLTFTAAARVMFVTPGDRKTVVLLALMLMALVGVRVVSRFKVPAATLIAPAVPVHAPPSVNVPVPCLVRVRPPDATLIG